MTKSLFSTIEKVLFILIAFIPLINGLGFVYIGAKRFNENWIKEGLIYEIPWFLLFLFLYHDSIGYIFLILGLIGELICIIRSFMVLSKLNEPVGDLEYALNGRKTSSSYWVIFALIMFLNGVGLMLVGSKRNVRRWLMEGAVFELIWILYLISLNAGEGLMNFIISLAVIAWILSIVFTIIVYFEEKRMDNGGTIPYFDNTIEETPIKDEGEPVNNIFKESPNPEIIPQFKAYNTQINELRDEFNNKEENITNLINNRFNKEELSYDRFTSVIDNCHKIFNHQADSALSIIHLAPEYSERLDESVKGKISILESINDEMNNLLEELIIHDDDEKQSDEDLKELFSNMDNLINSVKDYR